MTKAVYYHLTERSAACEALRRRGTHFIFWISVVTTSSTMRERGLIRFGDRIGSGSGSGFGFGFGLDFCNRSFFRELLIRILITTTTIIINSLGLSGLTYLLPFKVSFQSRNNRVLPFRPVFQTFFSHASRPFR